MNKYRCLIERGMPSPRAYSVRPFPLLLKGSASQTHPLGVSTLVF